MGAGITSLCGMQREGASTAPWMGQGHAFGGHRRSAATDAMVCIPQMWYPVMGYGVTSCWGVKVWKHVTCQGMILGQAMPRHGEPRRGHQSFWLGKH
jgi:hypothetical protein